jgi:diguanylate cyclase (GGDEF)-like protein
VPRQPPDRRLRLRSSRLQPSPGHNGQRGAQAAAHESPGSEDAHETLTVAEQTLADSDQTLSDADQTSADSDQTSADCDQLAADRDQAASDHDLHESNIRTDEHDATRQIRERTARRRDQTAQARLDAAEQRDAIADARDVAALARDLAADARDLAMAQSDAAHAQFDGARALTGAEVVGRAADTRKRAAEYRAQAAEQRVLAAQDRQRAAHDREEAARERRRALVDREMLARQLAIAETDALTGARARAAGLTELEHEVQRCRRTDTTLVAAYIDVVGLKNVNDTKGHAAGDELLKRVVTLTRAHLRPYDLIIRLGGDEFLCAMSTMTIVDARRRFDQIGEALASTPDSGTIRTGFAELHADDDGADKLIARADQDLLDSNQRHRFTRATPPDPDPHVPTTAARQSPAS